MPLNLPGKSISKPGLSPDEKYTDAPKGLVIAPFDNLGNQLREVVQQAFSDIGIAIFRLDDLRPGAVWVNAVTDAIMASDLIVVDLSRYSPNVLYELGYAHALRKPTMLLLSIRSDVPPPTDLQNYLYITYDPDNLGVLKHEIKRNAQRILGGN